VFFSEYQTMDEVQKSSNSDCNMLIFSASSW
jgi:hypothetical protein